MAAIICGVRAGRMGRFPEKSNGEDDLVELNLQGIPELSRDLALVFTTYMLAKEGRKMIAFPMTKISDKANLSFLKMDTFKIKMFAPDGKQTPEELEEERKKINSLPDTTQFPMP